MSYSCVEWRGDIGAYIVGALTGRARARVGRHLVACPGCRADYDELVPVRDWLGQLASDGRSPVRGRAEHLGWLSRGTAPGTRSDGAPSWPLAHEASGARLAARVPARVAGRRRPFRAILAGSRRWLLAAGATVAVAAVGILMTAGPPASMYHAVNGATGVSAQAQVHGTATGTEIDLTASGLPSGQRCILVAVARNGADIAGTWDATYSGSARIAGTSAIPVRQLTELRIESDAGVLLLSIRM